MRSKDIAIFINDLKKDPILDAIFLYMFVLLKKLSFHWPCFC